MHPLKRRGKSNDQLLSENEVMLLILIEIHFAFYELKLLQIIILIFSSFSLLFFLSHLLSLFFFSSFSLLFHPHPLFFLPSPPLFIFFSSLFHSLPESNFLLFFLSHFRSTFYHHLFDVMRLQRYAFIGQMTLLSSKSSGNPTTGAKGPDLHT